MKLQAEITGENHEIEIRRDGSKVFARIDEREYELEASEVEPNVFLFKHDERIYELFVEPRIDKNAPFNVKVKNHEFNIEIFDPKRLGGSKSAGASADGLVEIKTAMPGKVVRVLAEAGAEIKAGEGVIVVEAMKMQNELKSPKDGRVSEIRFTEGATVNAGEILAIIE
jgi:biotin carboxyl carrier protein